MPAPSIFRSPRGRVDHDAVRRRRRHPRRRDADADRRRPTPSPASSPVSGGLDVDGTATETLSGINTYTGATTIDSGETLALSGSRLDRRRSGVADAGTFDISRTTAGASITTLSGAGDVTLGAETLTLTDGADTFSGVIAGSGGLTVDGSATETLSGINTYTGATTIGSGETLALSGAGSIADVRGVADAGTFDISLTTAGASITTLSGAGDVTLGAKTLTLTAGDDTFSGVITGIGRARPSMAPPPRRCPASTPTPAPPHRLRRDPGALRLGSIADVPASPMPAPSTSPRASVGASITTLSGAGDVTLGADTLTLTAGDDTFSGVIPGSGGLTVDGSGTETLSGINTYTGATTIGSGETLALSGSGSIADSGVADAGTFDISAATAGASITTLSGAGDVTLGAETLTLTAGDDTFSGVISGTGGLTVDGSATETLSGINTYTGATTIDSGETLALSGARLDRRRSGVADAGTFDISARQRRARRSSRCRAPATSPSAPTR